MDCPTCGSMGGDKVIRSADAGPVVVRVRQWTCGHTARTRETFEATLFATSSTQPSARYGTHLALSLAPEGGKGGDPVRSVSDPESGSVDVTTVNHSVDRAREASSFLNKKQKKAGRGSAINYPDLFEQIWSVTGTGSKLKAFRKWVEFGQPSPDVVICAWRSYLLSDRPMGGYVQDLSTWFHGGGHAQVWKPAGNGAATRRDDLERQRLEAAIRQQDEQEARRGAGR